jgi:hypothetical protein
VSETLGKFLTVVFAVVICTYALVQTVYPKLETRGTTHDANIISSQVNTR